jgi:hypothetical protein
MDACVLSSRGCAGGSVEGRIVDPTGASIPKSLVRLLPKDSGETKYRTESDDRGLFRIDGVAAGDYNIRANHPGFQEESVQIAVTEGSLTKAATIVLRLLPCDAPGVFCDDFGTGGPSPDPAPIHGALGLHVGCAVDLDTGTPSCESSTTADLKFIAGDGGKRYLELTNGAKLCEGTDQRIRVDGLDGGNHWCIITSAKRRSQVYIDLQVVDPGSEFIGLFFMTR